jgi:phytoene synthase
MQELVSFSRQRIEEGSKSFALAARLFPPDLRASAYMLYAWCRYCDDLVDGQELGHVIPQARTSHTDTHAIVDLLERETRRVLAGETSSEPAFQALAEVCRRHDIEPCYPLELIEGFRMDADGRTYRTIDDTIEYCYHVAGVVGVMMANVMGVSDTDALRRASDLGIAFQMTNVARDVVGDHAVGRVYLPQDWLADAKLSTETLAALENRARLFCVVERLLDAAEPYYDSARAGLSHLPLRAAWAVASASAVYREIGTLVRQRGASAWDQRPATSRARKFAGIAGGLVIATRHANRAGQREAPSRDALWTPASLRRE